MTYSKIHNAMYGRGPKPELDPLDRQAWEVIRFFCGRKGFEWWWGNVNDPTKDDIFDELRKLLAETSMPPGRGQVVEERI